MLLSLLNLNDVHRIVYMSQARPDARADNSAANITGALCLHEGTYLQYLEGPAERLDALYPRIARDTRHHDVRLLLREKVEHRLFPGLRLGLLTWNQQTQQLFRSHLPGVTRSLQGADPQQVMDLLQALSRSPSWSEV